MRAYCLTILPSPKLFVSVAWFISSVLWFSILDLHPRPIRISGKPMQAPSLNLILVRYVAIQRHSWSRAVDSITDIQTHGYRRKGDTLNKSLLRSPCSYLYVLFHKP